MRAGAGVGPRLWAAALVAVVLAALTGTAPAAADGGTPVTYEGARYSPTYPSSPTGAQNQSKLWFHADAWWALLVEPTGRTLRVFQLMPDHTWRAASAVLNAQVGDVGDVLLDGDTVHVLTRGIDQSLYYVRLSFDAAARGYRVGAPVAVTTRKSQAHATIAKDSAGVLWAGYATAGNTIVTHSLDGGLTWSRFTLLAVHPGGQIPETAALVAFDDKVGMLWSDQAAAAYRFAWHRAGDDPAFWTREVAHAGPREVTSVLSITSVPAATTDTLFAAVRTAHASPPDRTDAPLIEVLIRNAQGQWSAVPVSTIADGLDDPVLQVDLATRTLRVFATRNGAVVTKTAPLAAVRFAPGIGDLFVNSTARDLRDPTVAANPVDARSGLVVLANDKGSATYRHAELSLAPATPVAVPGDRTPPTSPADLHAQTVSTDHVVLSWNAANDGTRWVPGGSGVPVAGYVVSRGGAEVAKVTGTTFEDVHIDAARATSLQYSVTAVDAAGNRSAPATLTVRVPAPDQNRERLLVALGLVALAGLLTIAYLVYRRRVARGAQMPRSVEQPARTQPRTRTPV